MTGLRSCASSLLFRSWFPSIAISCLAFCSFARGQVLDQDQEIDIHDLPALTARSHDPSDVLRSSLAIAFHDKEICCGKDSALEDAVAAADPDSWKDIAAKLAGRHLLSDGRPIRVTAEYFGPEAMGAPQLIRTILDNHPLLIKWSSHFYVVRGIVYRWIGDESSMTTTLVKLLLVDPRYSDSRREVAFTRGSDDPAKIEGFLLVTAAPQ
jgi:hypothetical protein